jgi:hypothetical protein
MGVRTNQRNYIYLDIDGVLNGDAHLVRSRHHGDLEFIPNAIQNLRFLIKETNSLIFISSTWRGTSDMDLQKLVNTFNWYDLGQYIIGQTPIIRELNREDEIIYHMKRNNIPIERMIIIDDDDYDIKLKMNHRLVAIDKMKGFTFEDYQKGKKLLGSRKSIYKKDKE